MCCSSSRAGLAIGLHTNTGNDGEQFDEACTGLDHVGFNVASRDDLEAWTTWLDESRASIIPASELATNRSHSSLRYFMGPELLFLRLSATLDVGYGFDSSAVGWLTVSGRPAFRDDLTAN